MSQEEGDLYGDLFLSAAHGQLENVQQLLSSGRIAAAIALNITREELTSKVHLYIKQAFASILSSVSEEDITIISVSNSMHDIGHAGGAGIGTQHCVNVSLNIKAAGGLDAMEIAQRMNDAKFTSQLSDMLTEKIRTVNWQPRWADPPKAIKYHLDDQDKLGCTAMHWAALNDRRELIAWLAAAGASVSATGKEGHTPLHWAALKGNLVSVAQLVKCGAELDIRDNWGFTALIRAAQNGHTMVVLELLNKGADPLLCDNEQHNCLHWAVYHRHHLVVSWLLKLKSMRNAIDALDLNGASALHLAAKKSGREMCRKLVAAGANVDLLDNSGLLAEKVAKEAKRMVNESYLKWYRRYPTWLRYAATYRDVSGRGAVMIPTCLGGTAVFFIALAYVYYALVILPNPYTDWWIVHAVLLVHTGPMWWCYYKSWKSDPGTIPSQPEQIVEGITNQEFAIDDVVMPAMNLKYPRAKYSRMFDCYVARFDHDCPWISNVVGLANIGYFIGFCYTVTVCLASWDLLCIRLMLREVSHAMVDLCHDRKLRHPGMRNDYCPQASDFVTWVLFNRKIMVAMLFVYIFFVVFTSIMCVAQVSQVVRNITTNEIINWHRYPGWQKADGTFKNPYDRGMWNNIKQFFQGYPSCPRGENLSKAREERESLLPAEGKAGSEDIRRFRSNGHGEQCCKHGQCQAQSQGQDHKRDDGGGEVSVEMSNLAAAGHVDSSGLHARNGRGSNHSDDEDVKRQLRDIGFDNA